MSSKRMSIQKNKIQTMSASTGPPKLHPRQSSSNLFNTSTLFQHVQNNLMCAGRHSYFVRVISVISFKSAVAVEGQEKLKELLADIVSRVNRETAVDKLTGLLLIYDVHSVQMVEGSEDCVGKLMKLFDQVSDEFFKATRVIMVYNNINQRLVNRIHYKYVDTSNYSTETIELNLTIKDYDAVTFSLMKQIYDLCLQISEDDKQSASKAQMNFKLELKYIAHIPPTHLLDQVLSIDLLQTIHEFSAMYGKIPDHYNYSEHVWPVPQDITPDHVFDWNKYDINLTCDEKEFE